MEQGTAGVTWPPPAETPARVLHKVWCAAVDAVTSRDFRYAGGELNEAAYLRYQRAVIEQALAELEGAPGE